jgi:tRNA (cytidine/uridine-2'-O-)-methyltransferase
MSPSEVSHGLNIVLVEPEIPQNTGSVGRLCVATNSTLHLVEPLGFKITESAVKRAGLDYWEHLKLITHANLEAFLTTIPKDAPVFLLSKKAGKTIYEVKFSPGSYLIFGKETAGLPDWLLEQYALGGIRIPMYDARVRSLNLATAVGICSYEAIRQIGP